MTKTELRFKALWDQFRKCPDESRRRELVREMGAMVDDIADGPTDPRWLAFAAAMGPEFNAPGRGKAN